MQDILRGICLIYAGVFLAAALVVEFPPTPLLNGNEPYELAQVSGVGISIGVAPNPDNSLAESLRAKEEELSIRERYLQDMASERTGNQGTVLLFVLVGQAVLLILLVSNFYLDYRARHSASGGAAPQAS